MRIAVRQREVEMPAERPPLALRGRQAPCAHRGQRRSLEFPARHGGQDFRPDHAAVGRHVEADLDIAFQAVDPGLVRKNGRWLAGGIRGPPCVAQPRGNRIGQGEAQARADGALRGNPARQRGPISPVAHRVQGRRLEEAGWFGSLDPDPADLAAGQDHEGDVNEALCTGPPGRFGIRRGILRLAYRRKQVRTVARGPGRGLGRTAQARCRQERGQQEGRSPPAVRLVVMG